MKMHPFVIVEPIFCEKSEPILQNEPIRILYPFHQLLTEKDSGLDTILSLFQLNPPMAEEIPLAWDEICYSSGGHDELRNIPQAVCTRDEICLTAG